MKQAKDIPIMITADEAVPLSKFSTIKDMDFCWELYQAYLDTETFSGDPMFNTMCVFALMYNTGRIQGIREERAKKRDVRKTEVPIYNIPMMSDEQWNELAKRKSPL